MNILGTPTSTGYLAAATSHTVTLPAGILADEIICVLALINEDSKGAAITGYTEIDIDVTVNSTMSLVMLTKVAVGSESGNVTLNITPSGTAAATVFAFRASGVDTANIFNSSNYSLLNLTDTATPSIPASTITTATDSGVLVALFAEASRSVTTADADFDTTIGNVADTNSLHVYFDNASGGANNPQYDFTMSASRAYNAVIFEFKSAASNAAPVIDTPEADIIEPAGTAWTRDISDNSSDADLDTLTYSVSPALPTGITLNTTTGVITATTSTAAQVPTNYTFTHSDGTASVDDVVSIHITGILSVGGDNEMDNNETDVLIATTGLPASVTTFTSVKVNSVVMDNIRWNAGQPLFDAPSGMALGSALVVEVEYTV